MINIRQAACDTGDVSERKRPEPQRLSNDEIAVEAAFGSQDQVVDEGCIHQSVSSGDEYAEPTKSQSAEQSRYNQDTESNVQLESPPDWSTSDVLIGQTSTRSAFVTEAIHADSKPWGSPTKSDIRRTSPITTVREQQLANPTVERAGVAGILSMVNDQ